MTKQTIPPALSAYEWKRVTGSGVYPGHSVAGDILGIPTDSVDLVTAAMALANYALPDGHPLKITREDVADMKEIAANGEWYGVTDVARVAAKLAALLPPEE